MFPFFPDKIEPHAQTARKTWPLKQKKENTNPETADLGKKSNAHGSPGDQELQVRYLNLAQVEPGRIVNDRYRVEGLIGRGGFGMVFAGFDLTLNTRVALKFFNPASLHDEKKFLRVQREINLSRKIGDPRIVRIFSLEDWSGIWFTVMELIESKTLKALLKEKGRFSWEEFRPIFLEILQGVESLHDRGIIHRDLKPSNITVAADGTIKILDFGLAKEIGDLEKTSSVGEIVGSPFYLSPEQIQNRELGRESDIYQLGILLFQALTGAYPFADTTTMGLVLMHLNQKPGRIQDRGIPVPRIVEFVVAKALAKRKQDRFRSAAEMGERLRKGSVPLLPFPGAPVSQGFAPRGGPGRDRAHCLGGVQPDPGFPGSALPGNRQNLGAGEESFRKDPLAKGFRPLRRPPGLPHSRNRAGGPPAPAEPDRARQRFFSEQPEKSTPAPFRGLPFPARQGDLRR